MHNADELRKLQEPHIDSTECLTPRHVRTLQIIAGAQLQGVVVYLGIALGIVQMHKHGQGLAAPGNWPVVSFMAMALLAITAPLAFVGPRIQTRLALRRILAGTWKIPARTFPTAEASDRSKLLAVHQATMLAGLAILSGTAFLACTAYLMDAQPMALGVVGVSIVLMLCKFPTEGRVRAWLERQADVLNELRQRQDVAGER